MLAFNTAKPQKRRGHLLQLGMLNEAEKTVSEDGPIDFHVSPSLGSVPYLKNKSKKWIHVAIFFRQPSKFHTFSLSSLPLY